MMIEETDKDIESDHSDRSLIAETAIIDTVNSQLGENLENIEGIVIAGGGEKENNDQVVDDLSEDMDGIVSEVVDEDLNEILDMIRQGKPISDATVDMDSLLNNGHGNPILTAVEVLKTCRYLK
jgi:hypothetical protein